MTIDTNDAILRERLTWLENFYNATYNELGGQIAEEAYNRKLLKMLDGYMDAGIAGIISPSSYTTMLGVFNEFMANHKGIERLDGAEPIGGAVKNDSPKENEQMGVHNISVKRGFKTRTADEREKFFTTWGLLTPRNLEKYPTLCFFKDKFVAPETIDLRDYCTETTDQGSNPWCAAYAAAGFTANVLWRKTDMPPNIDAEQIYKMAKEMDGSPNTDGTTLTAVYQAVLDKGYFDDKTCSVNVLRNKNHVKYAVHKFGCCLLGMMVTREWYYCNQNKTTISGKNPTTNTPLGGHAVLCCGYNSDGIIIQNSWGVDWGSYGFALITWDEFDREFSYGAVLDNCLYDTKMN